MELRHSSGARKTAVFALLLLWLPAALSGAATLASPNGHVQFRLVQEGGRLSYSVTFNTQSVIETSPLGIVVDGVNLAQGVQVGKTDRYRLNETYPWRGVHSTAVNRCHGAVFHIRHLKTGVAYRVEARAYDDGVAFRYIVPGPDGQQRVPDEATVFRIPAASTVWYHDFEGHYEGIHAKKAIEDAAAGDWAAPPLTVQLPGGAGFAAITEGALFNYSGMGLEADGRRGFHARLGHAHPASYPFRLRYAQDVQRLAQPAAIAGTITTPWRVVMVAPDLNTLVNCDIVHNVSPPPDAKLFPKGLNTEWLRPGRAVWRYLDGGENTLEGMKEFSRLAGQLGFEYNLIEGFWQRWSEAELRELVEYSARHNVRIWLWKHSRDLRDPEVRRAFFRRCREAGIAGVKLDFFDHEAKEIIDLYQACLRDAAEFRLMVNFHGANKPTGGSRTWPNEMTREGIRGLEYRSAPSWARHNTTWPFTRMLAGHADYTPVHFGDRRKETSWAHQMASAAILTSPLLVYGAHPKSILENPAVEVIKSLPSVWDETIVLPPSEIGEMAAFARRSGRRWFLAVMNGPTARTVRIPLSFLGNRKYQALLVRDQPENAAAVNVESATLSRADSVEIELRSGGGFIARFFTVGSPVASSASRLLSQGP